MLLVVLCALGAFAYWVVGLPINAYVYTTYSRIAKRRWDDIDTQDTTHLIWLALSALIWPLILVAVVLVVFGVGVLRVTQRVLKIAIEHR